MGVVGGGVVTTEEEATVNRTPGWAAMAARERPLVRRFFLGFSEGPSTRKDGTIGNPDSGARVGEGSAGRLGALVCR